MTAKLVRTYNLSKFRQGDTFFSRSDDAKSDVIVYAESWSKGKAGRKRAREAVDNPMFPSHAGSVLDSWGQKYPIEAGPRGYARGDFDEYRTERSWLVSLYRWKGFDDPAKQRLSANTLEYWARKNGNVRYDWIGAPWSTKLGRKILRVLLPWKKPDPRLLYCSEGAVTHIVVCGFLGMVFAYNTDLGLVQRYMEKNKSRLPVSFNPYDVQEWMDKDPEFSKIEGIIL